MFGPSWVNLYGSTRDYALSDEHQDLNNGVVIFLKLAFQCFNTTNLKVQLILTVR